MKNTDPRHYPWTKDTPYEIYAAGRWTGNREDPAWQARARAWAERNSAVIRGELPVKNPSPLFLTRELFFLHLTVREGSPEISRALQLLGDLAQSREHLGCKARDIPFEPADDPDFVIHAWLFSAAVFEENGSPRWREVREKQERRVLSHGTALSSGSLYNFLRGTLIIPESESRPGVREAVKILEARQENSGFWSDLAPWQMYNLMAHSTLPEAEKIVERLEGPLLEKQNQDGSWGTGSEKSLAAFLMAHGLQNRRKVLPGRFEK
jgi:hypothetical protein